MNTRNNSLQDRFLNALRKDKVPVMIYLTNGARLKGVIRGFDNFVVLIQQDKQQLVYKHAISTVIPERDVRVSPEEPTGN